MLLPKLLIANRGEIAARIARTARRLGLPTVAVYTGADRDAPHLGAADEAYFLGEDPRLHLDVAAQLAACRATGAGALHPGYGFLAENPELPLACAAAGVIFVGPPAEAMARLGDKAAAKTLAADLLLSGVPGPSAALDPDDPAAVAAALAAARFPLLIKAAAGGGGRGMRVVLTAEDLPAALRLAASEAQAAFGRGDLLLEEFLRGARHVEVQVLADAHGNVIHLGERDCSVQRRFQKLIEEAPSPGVNAAKRAELGRAATRLVAAAGYRGAATVEMLLLPDGRFFFLEVNTRLQVEHGVTELLSGLDLVEWQLRIAAGEPLAWSGEVPLRGHAIEARLCAEDPAHQFLPQTGRIAALGLPAEARVDHALAPGLEVGAAYDSMLAKILVHGESREQALGRLAAALEATFLAGIVTNKSFLLQVLGHPTFATGAATTRFAEEELAAFAAPEPPSWMPLLAAAWLAERGSRHAGGPLWAFRSSGQPAVFYARPEQRGEGSELRIEALGGRRYRTGPGDGGVELEIRGEGAGWLEVETGGLRRRVKAAFAGEKVWLDAGGATHEFRFPPRRREAEREDPRRIKAPMASRVKTLQVTLGQEVAAGEPLLTLEAMKLEHRLEAAVAGRVTALHVAAGDAVENRQLLVELGEL